MMSKRNKIFGLVAFLTALVIVIAIYKSSIFYQIGQKENNVSSIELAYFEDGSIFSTDSYHLVEIVSTIESSEFKTFFSEFRDISCYKQRSRELIVDEAIIVTYKDGSFEIITKHTGVYCALDKSKIFKNYDLNNDQFESFFLKWNAQTES